MTNPSDDERARLYRIAGAGFDFFGTILGCILAGYFLDRWLGTGPVLVLVGVALGFAVGLYKLVLLSRASGSGKNQ